MARIQILSIILSTGLMIVILELVRQRRLMERYALLWLLAGVVILLLSLWRGALEEIARAVGIVDPPNAIFVIAMGFILLLMLHFSLVISRLADEGRVLAQKLAMLEKRLHDTEDELVTGNGYNPVETKYEATQSNDPQDE